MRHRLPRRSILVALAVAAAPLRPLPAAGAAPADPERRVGLGGYDPVSYFTDGRPEKGVAEFSADFDDATYWFRSAEHRAMFVADPDRYAPQYAGFCAVTVARGAKAEADPHAWTISDGKLYMFQGPKGVEMFRQETAGIVGDADARWAGLREGR